LQIDGSHNVLQLTHHNSSFRIGHGERIFVGRSTVSVLSSHAH
jgi:hypothetical protein